MLGTSIVEWDIFAVGSSQGSLGMDGNGGCLRRRKERKGKEKRGGAGDLIERNVSPDLYPVSRIVYRVSYIGGTDIAHYVSIGAGASSTREYFFGWLTEHNKKYTDSPRARQ